MLNSTMHVQCDLNKNTSLGLVACTVWGSREAVEANLKSHMTFSVPLNTFSSYLIFYILERGFMELIYLQLIQDFELL